MTCSSMLCILRSVCIIELRRIILTVRVIRVNLLYYLWPETQK